MTSFDDRLAQAREEQRRSESESARLREDARNARKKAEERLREITKSFVVRAAAAGIKELTIGTLVLKDYEERTGFFRTEKRRATFFDETLGTGWLVPDRRPSGYSDYGDPERMFFVLRDGRWIRVGHSSANLWYGSERLRKNYVNTRLNQAVSPIRDLPSWVERDSLVAIDVTTGPVKWADPLAIADAEDLLIKELLRMESRP